MEQFVMGLDIGYSNLKITMGYRGDEAITVVRPVGAGPKELLSCDVLNKPSHELQVVMAGTPWCVAVEPDKLQNWPRELHQDYTSTDSYFALFLGALLLSERDQVDVLVTGLPVEQYHNEGLRSALISRLVGEHRITPKRSVKVKSVVVVPQPIGAYMDLLHTTSDKELLEIIKNGRTIVLDPGFYSVDWVALECGELRYKSSGTSLNAMSVLLAEACERISADYGTSPGIEKLEKALRTATSHVFIFGKKVDVVPYLREAKSVTENALRSLKSSMRQEGLDADIVLLTGGGAESYKETAQSLFPKSKIICSNDSVSANARGFWQCA